MSETSIYLGVYAVFATPLASHYDFVSVVHRTWEYINIVWLRVFLNIYFRFPLTTVYAFYNPELLPQPHPKTQRNGSFLLNAPVHVQ